MKEALLGDGTMLSRSGNESSWTVRFPRRSSLLDLLTRTTFLNVTDFLDLLRMRAGQLVQNFFFRLSRNRIHVYSDFCFPRNRNATKSWIRVLFLRKSHSQHATICYGIRNTNLQNCWFCTVNGTLEPTFVMWTSDSSKTLPECGNRSPTRPQIHFKLQNNRFCYGCYGWLLRIRNTDLLP